MIRINNVNKYFNKNKKNEIHVINDTTLEFPKSGLISLLGQSGSGKTTLLNALSGLDSIDSGSLYINDVDLSKSKSKKWDKVRSENIGYIFQNYYLLETETVYYNIEMVLNLIGIFNSEEVRYKVDYTLNAVGMLRFKNKLASDLSGGQKQRVAIARALVKNPEVIIADEPTGNLDSKNSVEVLKIIKEISKDKLVVLVTHNEELAYKYSDRIISLSDGRIVNDNSNVSSNSNVTYIDDNIYLKDLNHNKYKNINIYSSEDINDIEFTLVKEGNNFYLKSNQNITVNIINEYSNVKLIDSKQEDMIDTNLTTTSFNTNELDKISYEKENKKLLGKKELLIKHFTSFKKVKKKKKVRNFLQNVILIALGFTFSLGIFIVLSNLFVSSSNVGVNKNSFTVRPSHDLNEVFKDDYNIIPFGFKYNDRYGYYYSKDDSPKASIGFNTTTQAMSIEIPYLPLELINETLENEFDIVIDESILKKKSEYRDMLRAIGFLTNDHLIGEYVEIRVGFKNSYRKVRIGKTVNTGNEAIYIPKELRYQLEMEDSFLIDAYFDTNILNSNLYKHGNVTYFTDELLKGYTPVVVSNNVDIDYLRILLNNEKVQIVGTVDYIEHDNTIYTSNLYITEEDFVNKFMNSNYYTDYGKDISSFSFSVLSNLDTYIKNYPQLSNYSKVKERISEDQVTNLLASIIYIGGSLLLVALIMYFIVKSTLTSRIKEVSIIRSLGASKVEVKNMFFVDTLILITKTSLIGILISIIVVAQNSDMLGSVIALRVNPIFIIIVVIATYVLNLFVSMLPISKLLRKTPAQMLTHSDI